MTKQQHLIKWLKNQKHLRRQFLSDESGISKFMISHITAGRRGMTEESYNKLLPVVRGLGYEPPAEPKKKKIIYKPMERRKRK